MYKITPTEARKNLYNLVKEISITGSPVIIENSKDDSDSVILISKDHWEKVKNKVVRLSFERDISKQAIVVVEESGFDSFQIAQISYDGSISYYYPDIPTDLVEQIKEEAKKFPKEFQFTLLCIKEKYQYRMEDERKGRVEDLWTKIMVDGIENFIKEFQNDLQKLLYLATSSKSAKLIDVEIDYWQMMLLVDNYPNSVDDETNVENAKILLRQFLSRLEWIEFHS